MWIILKILWTSDYLFPTKKLWFNHTKFDTESLFLNTHAKDTNDKHVYVRLSIAWKLKRANVLLVTSHGVAEYFTTRKLLVTFVWHALWVTFTIQSQRSNMWLSLWHNKCLRWCFKLSGVPQVCLWLLSLQCILIDFLCRCWQGSSWKRKQCIIN